jgi:hypothetical protein
MALKVLLTRLKIILSQLVIFAFLSLPASAYCESQHFKIAEFSSELSGLHLPKHWQPLTFKKIPMQTHYELVKDGDVTVVKASSKSSASGLVRKVSLDLKEYPFINWRWKVDNLIQKSDATRKAGDDYSARIYITFAYEPGRVGTFKKLKYKLGRKLFGDIPVAAINYIWEPRLPVDTVIDNPYTSFAKMIVIESGDTNVGHWQAERRNVYQDYLLAFGEEPPQVNGVAIMTDTDNTGEQVTAYYGDIYFTQKSSGEAAGSR